MFDATTVTTTQVVSSEVIDWVAQGFVATHPVSGQTWEDLGLPTLYHTSILVGRWFLERKVETETTRSCPSRFGRAVFSTRTFEAYTWRFYDWPLANGCSGTYKHDDELTPFITFVSDDGQNAWDSVEKKIFGATRDAGGSCCRGRYGAYPQGPYGVAWVCHQACNAFAHAKWGVDPVFFAESSFLGVRGLWGVGDVRNPCRCQLDEANHCCVSGRESGNQNCCWFNTTYGEAPAWGFGMSRGWHWSKNWINTECYYRDQAVPIPGWDYPPVVQ